MKKGCFIIPYFGKLPNYFEVFAKSCSKNTDYQWLIFTNDGQSYKTPSNVVIKKMTFEEFLHILDDKFNFPIKILNYHKLCDFKPAYGYIFEEYIKDFQFWGYCDLDTIFGDLNSLITPDILSEYDKLFCLGHCVLFKNNYENNRLFMQPVNGQYWYKESFSSVKTTIFDETYGGQKNINTIFKYYGKKVLEVDWSFNCNIAPANLRRIHYIPEEDNFEVERYRPAIFVWDDGKILRYYLEQGELLSQQFIYMHFQARTMKFDPCVLQDSKFKVLGDGFYKLELPVTKTNFKKIKHTVYSLRKLKLTVKWKINGLRSRLGL